MKTAAVVFVAICSIASAAAPPIRLIPRLTNLSTRANVGLNDNVLIGGFIVSGSQRKHVIARGIGPSLANAGISGSLQDPTLELVSDTGVVISNDDWMTDAANVQQTGLAPTNSRESAIVAMLSPGAYTIVLRGTNGSTGVAVVELYDLLPEQTSPFLANISGRALIGTNANVAIGGMTVDGQDGTQDMPVVVRGLGPSLSALGVSGALQDPELFLFNANGDVLASNDNWKDTQQTQLQASGLAPNDDREAALTTTLRPGPYTAVVRGKNQTTGVGLIEIFDAHP